MRRRFIWLLEIFTNLYVLKYYVLGKQSKFLLSICCTKLERILAFIKNSWGKINNLIRTQATCLDNYSTKTNISRGVERPSQPTTKERMNNEIHESFHCHLALLCWLICILIRILMPYCFIIIFECLTTIESTQQQLS